MGFLSNFKKDVETAKRNKAAQINGKNLKGLLKKFKLHYNYLALHASYLIQDHNLP
jgi:hypothetical protein